MARLTIILGVLATVVYLLDGFRFALNEWRTWRNKGKWLAIVLVCLLPAKAEAELWTGVLDSSRAIDWSQAGAWTIPVRATQCGSTIAAYTGTAATINSAIASCTAGQHVKLGSGTFTLSDGIVFDHFGSKSWR